MSQVVPALIGTTVRTEILGLAYGTCWDVLSSPRACWDHRTVRGNPGHLCYCEVFRTMIFKYFILDLETYST